MAASDSGGSDLSRALFISGVVAVIVVVIVALALKVQVVQDDPEDLGADAGELLSGPPHDFTRALSTVNHENHPVNESRQDHRVCYMHQRRRIDEYMIEPPAQRLDHLLHFV